MSTVAAEALARDSRCCICGWRLGPGAPDGKPCDDPRAGLPDAMAYPICRFCRDARALRG